MSKFSKKHYEAIAASIRETRQDILNKEPSDTRTDLLDGVSYTMEGLALMFKSDNPNFKLERFYRACGDL